jgi:LPS-assembly protein
MIKARKVKHKYGLQVIKGLAMLSFLTFICVVHCVAQQKIKPNLTSPSPTKVLPPDSVKNKLLNDTSKRIQKIDTVDLQNVSTDSLDAPINYHAEDSGVLEIPTKKFILYGKAGIDYTDLSLTSNIIIIDNQKSLVTATFTKDSLGNVIQRPEFVQGENKSVSDTIFFNLKTRKGLTKSTFFQQGEIFMHSDRLKKIDDNTFYGYRNVFTTCNYDTPHFAFRSKKVKLINKKMAITGPAFPEFEGVPIPIGIPFGLFPLSFGRHDGILPPQFATNEQFGIGLEGLGYYKVINEYWDVTVRGDIYSYGGYRVNITPEYRRRYRYNGRFNISFQSPNVLQSSGKQEFVRENTFQVNWSHALDGKARPGTNFSASVNFSSSKFNQYVANNVNQNFQNQIGSSINYSKTWGGKYNLSLAAQHNQNNITRTYNVSLPNVNFSMQTIYPFQQKERIGEEKWYEKIGISYNGNLANSFSFVDTNFSLKKIVDTMEWTAQHTIPITLSLPPLGPVIISPSVSYGERWYGSRTNRTWNTTTKKLDINVEKGFYTTRDLQFGLGASTRLFGMYQFKKGNLIAIRHEVRPSLSVNYKPDLMKQFYQEVVIDTFNRKSRFSVFNGGFGEGEFGGMSFSLDNVLEMKVKDKNDTAAGATKKVKLIDGLGFSGSYNFFADSFKLSNISMNFRTNIFDKININAGANFDPYAYDLKSGRPIDKVVLGGPIGLGRLTNANFSLSTSFQSKPKDDKKDANHKEREEFLTPEQRNLQLQYARSNPAEFTDFNIPWSVNISASVNYTNSYDPSKRAFVGNTTANVNLGGDFSLTPKWKIGGNTYYDFDSKSFQTFTMFISREMHCWQMSINLTPVGPYRFFNITINPKSGILRDLKINRTRYFYGN